MTAGDAAKSYYAAMRCKDLPEPPVDSVERACLQCHETVWVHAALQAIADKSRGIICMPCAQELQNKSAGQLIADNIGNMLEILDEEMKQ
jgi:hypothetical protein